MNIDYAVITWTIIVEAFLLGSLWSTTMVRRVVTQTDRPLIVIICAVLGSLAILFATTFVEYLSFIIIGLIGVISLANAYLEYYFAGGTVLHEIFNVFVSLMNIIFIYMVRITVPIYLGAALGMKLATTRPLSWFAFFAPMATTLVFLLALVDDAFSWAQKIFESLYPGIINFILEIFGKYGAMAFQVIAPTTVIAALFWLGAIFGAKVATIRPWISVIFLTTIAAGLVFFLYGQPFYIFTALVYIGQILILSGPLGSLY